MTLFQLTRGAVRLSAVFMLQRANNGPAVMERLSNTLKYEHNLTYILLQEVRLGDKISLIECLLSSITSVHVPVCVPVSFCVCVCTRVRVWALSPLLSALHCLECRHL